MAYGLKYYGTFKDYFDRTITINVKEKDYAGSNSEVSFGYPAAEIEYNGNDEILFFELLSSALTFNVISESDFQYVDLYAASKDKFKVEVLKSGVNYWSGWISPLLYEEPYTNAPYPVSFVAVDGIKSLKDIDYAQEGVKSHIEIISYLLSQTNLGLNINESINIYEENHSNAVTDSPLTQTFVDTIVYQDLDCLEVLEDVLKLYGSRIYQKDNEWWIVKVDEFESELVYRKFNSSGVYQSQSTYDPEKLVGNSNDEKFANIDQNLFILPAWKKLVVTKQLQYRESFILNYDFSDVVKDGTTYKPNTWIQSNPGIVVITSSDNNSTAAYFLANNNTPSDNNFITQTIENFVESPNIIRFSIKLLITNYVGLVDFWIKIEMYSGTQNYYLTDNGTWSTTDSTIKFENNSASNPNNNFETYSINAVGTPTDGEMYVSVYASNNGNLIVDEFKAEMREGAGGLPYDSEYENSYILENGAIVADPISLLTADLPDAQSISPGWVKSDWYLNEQHVFRGGLYLNADKSAATQKWKPRKELAADPTYNFDFHLDNEVAYDKLYKMLIFPWVINGTILNKDLSPDSCIIDYNVNNKKYLISNGIHNLSRCMFNGSYIEIGTYSNANWILEDGTWNDDGIWIDGETWNDTDPTP